VDAVNFLIIALFVAAAIAIIAVQAVARHRRLSSRQASGQTSLPRSTWIVFAVACAFFLFAVLILPQIIHK
jgi:hypothetical protein